MVGDAGLKDPFRKFARMRPVTSAMLRLALSKVHFLAELGGPIASEKVQLQFASEL